MCVEAFNFQLQKHNRIVGESVKKFEAFEKSPSMNNEIYAKRYQNELRAELQVSEH